MHNLEYLHDILLLLFASVGIVIIFKQLSLSPALGYLVAGALIGPYGFGVLNDNHSTKSIADLGVIFLLFAIGLEFNFEKLSKMRRYVLGFGSLQVIITTAVIAYICYQFLDIPKQASIVIGSALALSSTAIVLQIISDHGEETTRVGRLSFAVLLMQDLAVIPILVLLPLLSRTDAKVIPALGGAIFNAAIAMMIIFAIGRLLLRPLYRMVVESRSDVLFFSITLIVVLGSAYLSAHFGLSAAFGAFTAGLMVAETEYKYRVEEEISSIKSLFLGLFFMTIGMSFQIDLMFHNLHKIIFASLALIIIKTVIIIALGKVFRFALAPAIHMGLLLSQGSEFAFIVFIMAVDQSFIEPNLAQFLATVVTTTMAITPLLASLGRQLKGRLYIMNVLRDNKIKREIGEISKHIVIIGFSKIGHIIAFILRKKGTPYLILDNRHRTVKIEKENGYNIYYGDPMNIDILHYIGLDKAEAVIVAFEDEIACMKITRFIHENFPNVTISTKSETINNSGRFRKAGAEVVVAKNFETGLQLAKSNLQAVGAANREIEKIINNCRNPESDLMKELAQDKNFEMSAK